MGKFFETYEPEQKDKEDYADSGDFMSAAEKNLLIEEGVAFDIKRVSEAETKFGPRWIVAIELEGEPRALGFGKGGVPSRDHQLASLKEWLGNGGESPRVKIVLNGRSQILVDAE